MMIQNDARETSARRMVRFVRENTAFCVMLALSAAMLGSIPVVINALVHSRASSRLVLQMTPRAAPNRLRFEKCMSAVAATNRESPSIDDAKRCRAASGSPPANVIGHGDGIATQAGITTIMSGAVVQ
jgi:hypothetical protein